MTISDLFLGLENEPMKLLNVGCGGNRPQDEHWTNLDHLKDFLKEGTPERANLDKEPRYVEYDLARNLDPGDTMPFPDAEFDGLLCSHVLEHLDCNQAVEVLEDCRRILKPGGLLVVSVPDANYFLSVHDRDRPENAVELFGEPIHDKWQPDFMSYALFHREHRQVLTATSLICLLVQAGFLMANIINLDKQVAYYSGRYCEHEVFPCIRQVMNRRAFSAEVAAIKPLPAL